MNRRGRPMKYVSFIKILKADSLYSPSMVVDNPDAKRLFDDAVLEKHDRRKIQNALSQFSKTHLPSQEDGLIEELGKPPVEGWYGWRWIHALPPYYFTQKEKRTLLKKQPPTTPVRSRKTMWIFAAILGMSIFSLGAVVSVYSEGFRILTQDGPRAALEFYQRSPRAKNDSMADFGKAWSKFSIGKLAEAEQDCYRLIQTPNLSPSVRGNAHYLLGHIQLSQIRLQEARANFLIAQSIYQSRGKATNLFQCALGLAEVEIEQGFLEEADEILENALDYEQETPLSLGHFYHLKTRIAFFREDYDIALEMSHLNLDEYQKHERKDGMVNALIDIGFYHLLLGSYHAGYSSTMQAHELILKTGIERQYYFNLANVLLFNKCNNHPIDSILTQIQDRVLEEGTSELQGLLDFVLEWECAAPSEYGEDLKDISSMKKGGAGAPDPPPPDGQAQGAEEGRDDSPSSPPESSLVGDGSPNPPPPDGQAPGLEDGEGGALSPSGQNKGSGGAPDPPPPDGQAHEAEESNGGALSPSGQKKGSEGCQ